MTRLVLEEVPCDVECGGFLRRWLYERGIDAHVTHVPPLIASPYEDINMRCPHGVLWHTAPTSEQIAKFAAEGTP